MWADDPVDFLYGFWKFPSPMLNQEKTIRDLEIVYCTLKTCIHTHINQCDIYLGFNVDYMRVAWA
jgi:hypothetical protein